MSRNKRISFFFLLISFPFTTLSVKAQEKQDIFQKLEELAIVERKVMVSMEDGTRLSTNIYRPKTDNNVPIIFSRHPYNINRWIKSEEKKKFGGVSSIVAKKNTGNVQAAYEAVKRGYAYVIQGVEVSGFIETILYISSDVKDTDFTVKLIDVYPDGTAYNLKSTIQRVRYREGYDKEVFIKEGQIYKLKPTPRATSNYFKKGHRIRIEVSSSNFPRFARNIKTGGNNYSEKEAILANNKIYHSNKYPSQIKLPIKEDSLRVKGK